MSWVDSWPLPDCLPPQPQWLCGRLRWTLLGCWNCYTCRWTKAWTCQARWPAWVMVPGRWNRPSLLEWQLVPESIVEGSVTLPEDAFCYRWCCGGHHDHDHILTIGGSTLSADARCCRPDACCHWSMMLLHFRLFQSDHVIGYHQRAHPDGFRLLGPLRRCCPLPQPLARPRRQVESPVGPSARLTPWLSGASLCWTLNLDSRQYCYWGSVHRMLRIRRWLGTCWSYSKNCPWLGPPYWCGGLRW
jgi:hypothetical protein